MSSSYKIIIITAPSGAGKTSITKHLLKTFPGQLVFSVSAATRQKREYEKDGLDYYFMTVEEFKEKIKKNAFVEWEMVYEGKYYGTLKSEIRRIWKEGKIPLLDIDVQGALHVTQQHPGQSISIFIEPPSVDELKKRLQSRGTESAESIETRTNKANYELSFKDHFDNVIVNNDLNRACQDAEVIVRSFIEGAR
ncbi:MAG TPA: guanylate kinase [Chitinophagaceae bacterium]|nr:guanylate kinase [Chitinophagaceae bacterium]